MFQTTEINMNINEQNMQNPCGSFSLSSSTTSTFLHHFTTASLNMVGRIFEQKAKLNILKKKKFPSRVLEICKIQECWLVQRNSCGFSFLEEVNNHASATRVLLVWTWVENKSAT